MYTNEDFKQFINIASQVENQKDIDIAFSKIYKKYPKTRFAISLKNHEEYFSSVSDIRFLNGKRAVSPFLESNSVYFISDNIYENMYLGGKHNLVLDSSITLDTNFASYISSFINRKNISNYKEVINIINQLLQKNVNFDYLYYLAENYKLVFDIVKKNHDIDSFWEEINPHMRENLTCLKLFESINREEFKLNLNTTPTLSRKQAEDEAKDLAYEFYYVTHISLIEQIKKRFYTTKIMLYKTIDLKFSSNKSAKNKTKLLIEFMMETLGVYASRDLYMSVKYFNNQNNIPILNKLNKSKNFDSQSFKKKVDNISWDLMIPRFIEVIASYEKNADFYIPFFLTFDTHLKKILDSYKAKIFIYENDKVSLTIIPTWEISSYLHKAIDESSARFFTKNAVRNRRAGTLSLGHLESLLRRTENKCLTMLKKNS